jgi:hypothetical protein
MTSPTPSTAEPPKPARRHRSRNCHSAIQPKFAVNTESEITRFHLCDQVDNAHDIRNAQPRATNLFLSSEEYRND